MIHYCTSFALLADDWSEWSLHHLLRVVYVSKNGATFQQRWARTTGRIFDRACGPKIQSIQARQSWESNMSRLQKRSRDGRTHFMWMCYCQ